MKINITIVSFLLIIGLGVAGMFAYKILLGPKPEVKDKATMQTLEELERLDPEVHISKDDFKITLPAGWAEITDYPEVLLMAVDTREEISEEILEKLDFRTNISIKSDDLGKYDKLNNAKEYAKSIETSLVQSISGIKFTHEKEAAIGGHDAFYIECESVQEGTSFKTLLVFIVGNRNDIYAISLNTFFDSWPDYKNPFYQMSESFKLKYIPEF